MEGKNGHLLARSFSTLRLLVLTCTCYMHTCACTVVDALLIWWGMQNMDKTWPCAGTYLQHIYFKCIVVSRAHLNWVQCVAWSNELAMSLRVNTTLQDYTVSHAL